MITAADQRLQISAYSLILDRRVGNYRLPDGWQVEGTTPMIGIGGGIHKNVAVGDVVVSRT